MIRVGIAGYGNLGRGVELALKKNSDMQLCGVFTRRAPESVKILTDGVAVMSLADAENMRAELDVMILCGGSATDLPDQTPKLAALFNTVDSFDTHARIPEYFASVDGAAKAGKHISMISVGWDPGLFSINRLYSEAVLTQGESYTFWGRGVSQGHSDALRRVDGVLGAVQYTVPVPSAIAAVREGAAPTLSTREKHTRECFVVAREGADRAAIEAEIKNMPNYFSDYDTTVNFISLEELKKNHGAMPHGGFVMRSGVTGENTRQLIEYSLKLESNPEFTSSVLVAYARAAHRLAQAGESGARTVLEIAPVLLSQKTPEELRASLL